MYMLGRDFHTLIKNVSFSSPTNVGSHNPPPSGLSVLVGTHSLFQSTWEPPIHLPSGTSVLFGTPPRVHPLPGLVSSLAHRPVSGSDTISNNLSPPQTTIVLFGTFLSGSLKIFKTRLLRRGFHTLLKNVLFSSPTDVRSDR